MIKNTEVMKNKGRLGNCPRKLRRHSNSLQCDIMKPALEQKTGMNGPSMTFK